MVKEQLIKQVSHRTGISTEDVLLVTEQLFATIKETVRKGEDITVRKFGRFGKKQHKAKRSNLPGAPKQIPARTRIYFRPSKHYFAAA